MNTHQRRSIRNSTEIVNRFSKIGSTAGSAVFEDLVRSTARGMLDGASARGRLTTLDRMKQAEEAFAASGGRTMTE